VILHNFGGNVRFTPSEVVTPAGIAGVLECLDRLGDGTIRQVRPVGRLHSWSDVIACEGVVLDLRHFNAISLETLGNGDVYVDMGAGCTIDEILDFLASHGGYTLPTFGMTGRQTIAGAIATATHGTGRSTLSHYVAAALVAAYDSHTGRARTYRWEAGDQLGAIRCGLGCAGIVLSIRMRVVRDYPIEERTAWFDRLEQALSEERDHPIQQFYLMPWSWRWFSQLRRPLASDIGAPAGGARLQRAFRLIAVDLLLNGAVCLLSGILGWGGAIRWWYSRIFPLVARSGMRTVDRCRHVAMMRHDFYRHVEMELFVPAPHVSRAAAFIEWALRQCGGESSALPAAIARDEYPRDVSAKVAALRGRYVHDHPILFRKVLADDALISMTSGDDGDAWYAISFITYQRDLGPFLAMCDLVAAAMASAYRVRPHWGKICTLTAEQLAPLYPRLARFRAHCAAVDPKRVLVNEFATRCLGL
jgi:L-gulonolactone oxidase